MLHVHNFRKALGRLGCRTVKFLDSKYDFLQKFILHFLMYQKVIRSYACLAGIDIFPPDYPFGSQLQIRCLIHNTRAFSSQFQTHRSQVMGGGLHDQLPYLYASGKEDIVKLLGKERLVGLPSSFYH